MINELTDEELKEKISSMFVKAQVLIHSELALMCPVLFTTQQIVEYLGFKNQIPASSFRRIQAQINLLKQEKVITSSLIKFPNRRVSTMCYYMIG